MIDYTKNEVDGVIIYVAGHGWLRWAPTKVAAIAEIEQDDQFSQYANSEHTRGECHWIELHDCRAKKDEDLQQAIEEADDEQDRDAWTSAVLRAYALIEGKTGVTSQIERS